MTLTPTLINNHHDHLYAWNEEFLVTEEHYITHNTLSYPVWRIHNQNYDGFLCLVTNMQIPDQNYQSAADLLQTNLNSCNLTLIIKDQIAIAVSPLHDFILNHTAFLPQGLLFFVNGQEPQNGSATIITYVPAPHQNLQLFYCLNFSPKPY